MLLGAVCALLFTDPGKAVTAMIAGSHAAVKLSIELVALYGFWLGFFGIVEKTGIADFLGRVLHPIVKRLFPGLSKEGEKYVTMNMAANLLGLGNASTPMAIKAIAEMEKDLDPKTEEKLVENGKLVKTSKEHYPRNKKIRASKNMIMLTVISCTSLQLLPTTVIGLRATHGSVNPVDFLLPTAVATVASTLIGIVAAKLLGRLSDLRQAKRARALQTEGEEKRSKRLKRANKHAKKAKSGLLERRVSL